MDAKWTTSVKTVCLRGRHVRDDGIRAIELTNGLLIYPEHNNTLTWKRVKDRIIIHDQVSLPLARTRDTSPECWSYRPDALTIDQNMFLSIIFNKCPSAELVLK